MRAAQGIPILAAGLGLAGAAVLMGMPERAVPGPSIRSRPVREGPASPPPKPAAVRVTEPAVGPLGAEAAAAEAQDAGGAPETCPDDSEPRIRMSGIVVDELGTPIECASVLGPAGVPRVGAPKRSWYSETDADGHFSVVIEARELREQGGNAGPCLVHAHGYLDAEVPMRGDPLDAAGASVADLRVVLRRAAIVEGIVRGIDGLPIPRCALTLGAGDPASCISSSWFRADAEGRFRLTGTDPGEDPHLEARAWGLTSGPVRLREILRPGETVSLDLHVTEPPQAGWWRVAGAVVDESAQPVAGAAVEGAGIRSVPGRDSPVVTGADGRFEGLIEAFPPDEGWDVGLEVRTSQFGVLVHEFRDDEMGRLRREGAIEDLRFVVRPAAAVRGRVVDADGIPVGGARVILTGKADGGRWPSPLLETKADAAGNFLLEGIDPGGKAWLRADCRSHVSRYVSLAGLLGPGGTLRLDIPFPLARLVKLEVLVREWKPGMTLAPQAEIVSLAGPKTTLKVGAGPRLLFLLDGAEHCIACVAIDIPYDVESWQVEIEAESCVVCARGGPSGKAPTGTIETEGDE